ncbi:DUF6799 domain-containing protein [Hymenobacter psoromatis]|uniref:DUF6799 domain-containing protein n=1 Tax=Hymenobacter psoromatis TaxID=1484116 RepID=UPI001CBE1F66|nr:DUF6799 domain-containing protein [Hymenobacter psoromatis]
MRIPYSLAAFLFGAGFWLIPHPGAAQSGGVPVHPGRTTQYVFRHGEVMERVGRQLTPLTQNIRLPNGTKINVRSGIVEFPGGKVTSLHEEDYLNAEGGIVFATPASAAAARGDNSVALNEKYNKYVQVGAAPTAVLGSAATDREALLTREVELLQRKVTLLQQTHPNPPATEEVDKQLQELDAKLKTLR